MRAAHRHASTAMGHEVVLAPLLDIVPVKGVVIPDRDYQAIAFTSANGARASTATWHSKACASCRPSTVGPHSADAARAVGFSSVTVAGGDGKGLAAHLAASA